VHPIQRGVILLSARRVGASGMAYGVDMTDEMLTLARSNASKTGAPTTSSSKARSRIYHCPRNPWMSLSPIV
jgi:hypothetical protein